MAERKPFLLRLSPEVHESLQRWANDEVRSLNAQIEFLLRRALRDAGRLKPGLPAQTGRRSNGGP
ncbi:MAG TPA: toxin-antitoxin system HicB family antitoxin [Vicinamibacterales bacterium]|nr:toxin-antitoxin system HicB family antitoxin [Vicinamibacterales bacterium]HOG29601.1 toxin-antitoxin system HicB family antitoxin [Vicinamibacterales bacterium]HPW21520.1 toxin-antitoxin system HicB family antitoxin [Vicinamibacterales bacterium]